MRLDSGYVAVNREEGIGWLIFDKPARLNAISRDMVADALAVIEAYEADESIRVVIMRGSGEKAFISGADISRFEGERGDSVSNRKFQELPDLLRSRMANLSKPLIAMIHGYCLGGGLAIALTADMRFASPDAQFGIPAAQRAVAYPAEGLQKLVDLVGPSVAKDLMFSARRFDAEEALRSGLINRIVPGQDLERETLAYARLVAGNAPLSVRASKYFINQLGLARGQRDEARMSAMVDAAADSADFREATRAFLEKRKPVFRGV